MGEDGKRGIENEGESGEEQEDGNGGVNSGNVGGSEDEERTMFFF